MSRFWAALRQGYDILPGGTLALGAQQWWLGADCASRSPQRLAFDIYGGQQDDREPRSWCTGFIAKNQAYFSNVMYRLAPNVIVSLEGGQVRTTYFQVGKPAERSL